MSLRHPAFVRWSVYIEECLDVLSSETGTLPSDRWLCDLIRIQHIAEDAAVVFSMDDPISDWRFPSTAGTVAATCSQQSPAGFVDGFSVLLDIIMLTGLY